MLKRAFAVVLLLAYGSYSMASSQYGIVTDVTPDAITISEGGPTPTTYKASIELLTNTVSGHACNARGSDKLTAVKKGDKLCLECYQDGADLICWSIQLHMPSDAGIVTEVSKDSITIRSDKGKTITYKVRQDIIENGRYEGSGTFLYPSRFSEVKPGCRIEISGYVDHGEFLITGMDVQKETEKKK